MREAGASFVTEPPANFMGVPGHLQTMNETEELIVAAMRDGHPLQQAALNVAELVKMWHDPDLALSRTTGASVHVATAFDR